VPQATASEGLSQGPYVATRAGFKPMPLQPNSDNHVFGTALIYSSNLLNTHATMVLSWNYDFAAN